MDDIIPFLIVIAISIIGAAARGKKKRDASGNIIAPSNSKRNNDEIFSWLEKFAGEEEQVIPNKEPLEQTIPVNFEKPIENKKIIEPYKKQSSQYTGFISPKETQELIEKEGNRIITGTAQKINQTEKTQIKIKNINNKNVFNLKKAVIYTEILNRKYI